MQLAEFYCIDLAERAYFELQSTLEKYKLLENNNNFILFDDFIKSEKSQSVLNPNTTDDYFPLYMHSAPVTSFIKGQYLSIGAKFIKKENERMIFNTNYGSIKFPLDRTIGDGRIDLLIFDTEENQQHFITMLKLKFSDWQINLSKISI